MQCKSCGKEIPDDGKDMCQNCRHKRNDSIRRIVGSLMAVASIAVPFLLKRRSTEQESDEQESGKASTKKQK